MGGQILWYSYAGLYIGALIKVLHSLCETLCDITSLKMFYNHISIT